MDLLLAFVTAADPVPEPEDVRAGWLAFWLFVGLVVATALLLWSFVRQIRKTRANAERGVFGDAEQRSGQDVAQAVDESDETRA